MQTWQGIVLGLLQGATEFLPVSSSGHLVLVGEWLGVRDPGAGATVEVVLHCGTLLAVVFYFRRDLLDLLQVLRQPGRVLQPAADDASAHTVRFLCIATLLTGSLGLLLAGPVESLFGSTRAVGAALLVTTALLVVSRFVPRAPPGAVGLTVIQAVVVGLAQTLAIVPGVSRSGSTIVAALVVGIASTQAGRLSFLLAVPIILAATVLQWVRHPPELTHLFPVLSGAVVAMVSGYYAMKLTLRLLQGQRFHWFAWYTGALALVAWMTS